MRRFSPARAFGRAVFALGGLIPAITLAATALVTPANQNEHLQTLFTPAVELCVDLDGTPDAERVTACQAAVAELDRTRAAAGEIGVTGTANFDFIESLLQVLLGLGYIHLDNQLSARACGPLERSWALRVRLLAVPKSGVNAENYKAYREIPDSVDSVISNCRKAVGTPDGAPPLPSQIKY